MSKEDWDIFIGTKKRTAKTHFSQGRKCARCNRFITNGNKTGMCQVCYTAERDFPIDKKPLGETDEHRALKERASKWLTSIGCIDVKEEVSHSTFKGRIIVDAQGVREGSLIVVECGGSQARKLEKVMLLTNNIFILPYNFKRPFLFRKGTVICPCCGNLKRRSYVKC